MRTAPPRSRSTCPRRSSSCLISRGRPEMMKLDIYHRAADRAAQWCLALQNADGSIQQEQDCFDSIYKFPAMFVTLGHAVEGAKLLNWLENNTLTDAGDLTFARGKFAH